MTRLAERMKDYFFGDDIHPYRQLEHIVDAMVTPESTLLDAGCGRTAPILRKYRGRARRLIGIDLVDFVDPVEGVELHQRDLADTGLAAGSVDVIMCRSVMEHLEFPEKVYAEFARVLRPGGRVVFITASKWDYASLIAAIVPNRFHPWIVARTEGRAEHDVFPIHYRTNTHGAIRALAKESGMEIERLGYLGQYPSYLMFNAFLFLLGTAYEKLLRLHPALGPLQGWIIAVIRKPGAIGSTSNVSAASSAGASDASPQAQRTEPARASAATPR